MPYTRGIGVCLSVETQNHILGAGVGKRGDRGVAETGAISL